MEQKDYRLAAIMYTDIAGFSRMMEKDEAGTLEMLRFHNELIGQIVASHHGTVIKTIGDALLVDFKNTVEALQSALEIQDRLYAHNKEHAELPLLVRVGLHLGDIYFFENDALGEGINIAARLQSLARPGCICFSQDVYNLVLNKIEFRAEKLGKVSLKNITKEIHAYEITTPNVEFDPGRDKPRAGYTPGSYLEPEEEKTGEVTASAAGSTSPAGPSWAATHSEPRSASQAAAPALAPAAAQPAPYAPARPSPATLERPTAPASPLPGEAPAAQPPVPFKEPDREYSEEGSRNILAEIRKAILTDIKNEGRRITVREARERYGYFGVEAQEVIASMADQGLLARERKGPDLVFGASGSNSEIGRNIEAAVEGIVSEIERSVERGLARDPERYRRHAERFRSRVERHAIRDRIREDARELETGKWDKKLQEDEAWKPGAEELTRDFEDYRLALKDKARKIRGGFIGNLVSFLSVNGVLWFINLSSAPSFPWAAIVSAGWGIGLLGSFFANLRAAAKAAEAEQMPALDPDQLKTYKKLNRVKDSIVQHGASAVSVPFLLVLINMITSPTFPWFAIPTVAIVLSLLSHLLAYRLTKPRLEKELKDSLGVKGPWSAVRRAGREARENAVGLGPYAELFYEAERTKAAILQQAESSGTMDADLGASLGDYVGQVRLLAQSANEIDAIVEAIPMGELAKDKASLLAKEKAASNESLRAEYHKSVEEIERQEQSYEELKNQSEVIRLRLGSSVNQLKQMRIDLARVKAAGEGEHAGVDQLRRRTDELSRYLEDLRKGYDESRKDPFAELEAAEKARAALEDKRE